MNTNRPVTNRSLLLTISLGLLGCTNTADHLSIQSKFAYPNGDYSSLGHVGAEKRYMTLSFSAPEMNREIFPDLQQRALATKPGADFVVDYFISSTVTSIPPIPVSWTTFRLDGTAIKLTELGEQQYRNGVVPSPTRTK
jgi:hypothetical protein